MPGRQSEGRGGGRGGRGRGRGRGAKESKDDAHHRPTSPTSGDDHAQLSEEAQLLVRLRQKTVSHPTQQCQLAIYVPPYSVGAVIGRGGRTIVSVQREAMRKSGGHGSPVKITVLGTDKPSKASEEGEKFAGQGKGSTWNYNLYEYEPPKPAAAEDPAEEDDGWIPVVIRGDPVACFAAVRQLLPIVENEHDPDIVFEVPIHRAKHNMLVGKGGVVIASLSATYDTRIMIPPNDFMSNVEGGGDNVWTQNAGSKMLFEDDDAGSDGAGGHETGAGSNNMAAPGMLPDNPNIIQLEGEIDNVEKCLVQMLSIVAGGKWTPLGVIVDSNVGQKNAVEERGGGKKNKMDSPKAKGKDKGKEKDVTTAEATIVKVWTPSSKLLNLGKIRKVQRKTNTVIRRKKLRLPDGEGGKDELVEEEAVETKDEDDENENDEEEEEATKEASAAARTATKYIITGKTESVKAAAAQFEKILGLETGSATITDTTHKTKGSHKKGHPSKKDKDRKDPQSKPDDDADQGAGKNKKRGKKKGRWTKKKPDGLPASKPTVATES